MCQCEESVVQRLEQDFKVTLQQQNSLEQWAAWLDGVVSQVLKPYQGSAGFPKAAKLFLLKWSFYRCALALRAARAGEGGASGGSSSLGRANAGSRRPRLLAESGAREDPLLGFLGAQDCFHQGGGPFGRGQGEAPKLSRWPRLGSQCGPG